MGCCGGDREKGSVIKNDVKWEYINLNDFKTQSCLTPLAYAYLWLMLIVSISVYAVDTFTAINLLAFNKWAGQIQPALPLKYSRWIFAGCIILSFALLIYRWGRALKVMRGGKVAKSYLDPLAVRVECIRMGDGQGWRRFLVFAELTKSRKGADYVALFAYYSFEAWLRIVLAEGPRVVINGITLFSYAQANFVPIGDHAASQGQSPFVQFWLNVGFLVETNKMQAAVVFGMLWTCFIWIISAFSLGISVILYLIFLWHHIPSGSGGLGGYCRQKVNRRMERIVRTKTNDALRKENEVRARQEARANREGGMFKRQPTLPDLASTSTPSLAPLSRSTTTTTLPEYSSRPATVHPSDDGLPPMPTAFPPSTRPQPKRHVTAGSDTSWASYNSDVPLMNGVGDAGSGVPYDRVQTPASATATPWSERPDVCRSFTDSTAGSNYVSQVAPSRPGTAQTMRQTSIPYRTDPISRPGTSMSGRPRARQGSDHQNYDWNATPTSAYPSSATMPRGSTLPDLSVPRTRTLGPQNRYFSPVSPISEYGGRGSSAFSVGPPTRSNTPAGAPAPNTAPSHIPPQLRRGTASNEYNNNSGYVAFNPDRSQTPSSVYQSYTRPRPPNTTAHPEAEYGRPHTRERSAGSGTNLRPSNPPQRVDSFDDILDHY